MEDLLAEVAEPVAVEEVDQEVDPGTTTAPKEVFKEPNCQIAHAMQDWQNKQAISSSSMNIQLITSDRIMIMVVTWDQH